MAFSYIVPADWYHNTAVIIFACLASWFVAIIGGGLAWVFLVMAVCGTYYRTSLRRVRRNFRDDINRTMAKKMSDSDNESLEWMNNFLIKFWPIYAPVLADTVVASVDQVLSTSTPAFLDSMRMSFFTLGSKPPRLEYVRSHPKVDEDTVLMDWRFSFTPNDTVDMTARQLKNKINPKVILEVRIGKGVISKAMPIIVEDFAFSGLMRVKIKLQIPFPHIDRVEICFLEKPTIDYVCKPIGGDMLGFDINFIPGLESFIMEQIHANLAPIMYAPNVFPIEVAKMLSGSPVDQAIGVVAVTIYGAQGLKNHDKLAGDPDPYAVVSLNARDALAKTKIIKENANPKWNETKYIIVTSLKDSLTLQIFDYNEYRKDKELGTATFPLENLEQISEYDNEQLEVMSNGKARGIVSADIRFFPVLQGRKLEDGKQEPPPESNTGIARFTVEQAKDLDGTKSLIGALNPYAVLLLNNREIHTTRKLKRTNNPIWDNGHKEILITDRKSAKLGLVIKDERELAGITILGTYQIKLDDMMDLTAKGQEWYNLAGVTTGRAKMSLQWKPVALSGVGAGTGGYVTPIGVMRVHLKNARDLRNVETMGKSDPYVRVLLSGIEKGRTVTFQNNLNPDWDEVIYVPMHNSREKLLLEVMDEENLQKDRSLGSVEVLASDYIHQADNGEFLVHDQKVPIAGGLRQNGKGAIKGTLNFTVSFYPCLNIADPEEDAEEEKDSKQKSAAEAGRLTSLENGKPAATKDAAQVENEVKADNKIDPVLQKRLAEGEKEQKETGDEKSLPKIRLTPEELVKHECGLIIFKLLDTELTRSNVHVEIVVDDMAYPSYISSTIRSRKINIDEIGDCFVRELDFSKLTIRLRDAGDKRSSAGTADEKARRCFAKITGNTLDTLKQCIVSAPDLEHDQTDISQNNPTILKLRDSEGQISTIKVSLKYIPVEMNLDPSESINNMGSLRVDVLDAKDLPSADRNGYSDPFCKFELNEQSVFKTQVQKKTLHPSWNEFFEVEIPSRTAAKFQCKVYDWDFASEPDFLGATAINLELLEPFKPQEYVLNLDGKSGTIRLKLLFKPAYVTRSRQGSSTFSGTFAAPGKIVTGVAGAPIKGVGMAAHGVGKGASFIKHGFKSKSGANGSVSSIPAEDIPVSTTIYTHEPPKTTAGVVAEENLTPQTPEGPALAASPHSRTKSAAANSLYSTTGNPAAGTANFTIVSASGYPPSSNVMVFVKQLPGKKVIYKTKHIKSPTGQVKFDESFKYNCSADTQFQVQVKAHATFGSDDDLGEALFFVDESGTSQEKTLSAGSGSVILKSNFVMAENGATDSPKGGLRKGLLFKKENGRNSRDVTPTPP
jgi:Ca2+-dependent lipid-binding protein